MPIPEQPKIYHIVHVDRLASIIASGSLLSDAQVIAQQVGGTTIGMNAIKQRRLQELVLTSHPDLYVGQCVPFYFCPRSIMLYLIYQRNHPELSYRGGQAPILHLQADLYTTVQWAQQQEQRWAFALSNAGSRFFEDRCDLAQLDELDWTAIGANRWQQCKEGKQAEFLLERHFPWHLVEYIGVHDQQCYQQVANILQNNAHRPPVNIERNWYY